MECSIPKCTGRVVARSLCHKHYRRWKRHGDPNIVKYRERGVSIWKHVMDAFRAVQDVRDPDACMPYSKGTRSEGYPILRIRGKVYRIHRMLYVFHRGLGMSDPVQVYHTCGNRTCLNVRHMSHGSRQDRV